MLEATCTITAPLGPGRSVTSKVFSNIKAFYVDVQRQMLYLYPQNDDVTGPVIEFALSNTVTFTATITAGAWAVTVSVS